MTDFINPYREYVADISPTEFEKYCFNILKCYAEKENLKEFSIIHNKKIESRDGIYQIDIYAEFTALNVKFRVITECKRYTNSIGREKIVVLADKVKSIGAQKGILISTSGFQSGAIKYAKEHGITLLQIFDKDVIHIQNSVEVKKDIIYKMERELFLHMPQYYAYEWDEYDFPSVKIYPSEQFVRNTQQKIVEKYKYKLE